jgi:hypothetical protein
METDEQITVILSSGVVAELRYLIELNGRMSPSLVPDTVEELITQVMTAVADGSRRPGAWERQVIEMLGLVADCPEHESHRKQYGRPKDAN